MSIQYQSIKGVAVLTIDRPQALNALDVPTLQELRSRLAAIQDDPDLRCVVITGAGEKSFCAGADLKGSKADASYAQALFGTKAQSGAQGVYPRLMDFNDLGITKPMVAAVNGYCLGGGLELALQCDIRIASIRASFGLPEVVVGSIPGVSGVTRLIRAIGTSHAMQMALGGERIDAQRAMATGLVSELVAADALLDRALAIANRIAANAPLAVQAVKRLARATFHLPESDAQELTELHWGVLRDTQDRIEGRAAFAEKRTPTFVGR